MKITKAHRWVINSIPLEELESDASIGYALAGVNDSAFASQLKVAFSEVRKGPKKRLYRKYRWVVEDEPQERTVLKPKGEQKKVLQDMIKWAKSPDSAVYEVFGPAGTGKSALAAMFNQELGLKIAWMAPTGRAAQNLRNKGLPATTVHGGIYIPNVCEVTGEVTYRQRPVIEADLIGLDEAPMVNSEIRDHLKSFRLPIMAFGDPFQLPPVEGESGFATDNPRAMLQAVQRVARDNPILKLVTDVREGRPLRKSYGREARIKPSNWFNNNMDDLLIDYLADDSIIVCGTNVTRNGLNAKVRQLQGWAGPPQVGETLVCLRNQLPFVNGSNWRVIGKSSPRLIQNSWVKMVLGVPKRIPSFWQGVPGDLGQKGEPILTEVFDLYLVSVDVPLPPQKVTVPYRTLCFGDKLHWKQMAGFTDFTWGYVSTAHRMQGSEQRRVLVLDESPAFRDMRTQWLYTATSRAKEQLVLVGDY